MRFDWLRWIDHLLTEATYQKSEVLGDAGGVLSTRDSILLKPRAYPLMRSLSYLSQNEPIRYSLIADLAEEILQELNKETRLTAGLSILREDQRSCEILRVIPGLTDHSYVPRVGLRTGLEKSAFGKAMLANLEDDGRIASSRLDAYCSDFSGYPNGVGVIASSCVVGEDKLVASVWVAAFASDVTESQVEAIGRRLAVRASQLEKLYMESFLEPSKKEEICFEKAKQFIDENFDQEEVVRNYIDEIPISYNWFSKKFKELYGESPMHYRSNLLHSRACELLKFTHLSIKEIAYKLAFDNQNYFSRSFKKREGVSPARFRELEHSQVA